MRNRGGYGSALIKNGRYWPKGVHGDAINEYFSENKLVMWGV